MLVGPVSLHISDMIDYPCAAVWSAGSPSGGARTAAAGSHRPAESVRSTVRRPVASGQQTCREAGAFQQWTKKQSDDPVFKAYRKEYKKRFAWIKAGRITDEQFYAWSEQAREMKRNATGRSSPWTSSRTGWGSREDKSAENEQRDAPKGASRVFFVSAMQFCRGTCV